MGFVVEVSKQDIDKVIKWAMVNDGKFFGQTYEQGLRDALDWILGEGDHPLKGEEGFEE